MAKKKWVKPSQAAQATKAQREQSQRELSGRPGGREARVPIPRRPIRREVSLLNALTLLKRQGENLEAELRREVRAARRAGASWTVIGNALGMTQQGASKRWGPYPAPKKKPAPGGP